MFTLARQLKVFSAVGVFCAVVDFGLYFTLTKFAPVFGAHKVVASILTSLVAMTVGFMYNSKLTFSQPDQDPRAYLRYLAVYGCGAAWQNMLLAGFLRFEIWDWFAKGLAILIVAYAWNFSLAKFWVFRYTADSNLPTISVPHGKTDI